VPPYFQTGIARLLMVGVRFPFKKESMLLSATIMSVVIHCMIASLFVFAFKSNRFLLIPQTIISVDIRSLEPETDKKPQVVRPLKSPPQVTLSADPPLPIRPIPVATQKPAVTQTPKPAATTSITRILETTPPVTQPIQTGKDSTHNSLVQPVGGNAAKTSSFGKDAPTRRPEPVDIRLDSTYLAALREVIERNKEYPLTARKGHMEGTVHISCILSRNGELRGGTVVKTSGFGILDYAALRAVRAVGQFPLVPPEIKGDSFSFTVPITFRLGAE